MMGFKILIPLVTVLVYSRITHQQTTPEERCKISGNGARVCIDCKRTGICVEENDGRYSVHYDSNCPEGSYYCDDTLYSPGIYGRCFAVASTSTITVCTCSTNTQCIADPNNPAAVLHCESSPPVTDPPCPTNSVLDTSTCKCSSCSDTCQFLDDPNDECTSFFACTGTGLIRLTCSGDACFSQEDCTCEVPPLPTCPPGCPLVDDPYDDCKSFFFCNGDTLNPLSCSDSLCFDQDSCACVDTSVSSTTTTTAKTTTTTPGTQTPCPPGCPFVDDPNDDCASYFICSGSDLIPIDCADSTCFDQDSCGCVPRAQPTTSATCPDGCPFLDDPNDDCQGYFVCSGSELLPIDCADSTCFDQDSCGCVPRLKPTTAATCPDGCPFLDDPNDDCHSYFICSGSDLIPVDCADDLCFDQSVCGCAVKQGLPLTTTTTTTATTTTTTKITCPADCSYIDDPNDNCGRFYYCDEDGVVPYDCPGNLCFSQAACECL